ncbi:indolethylamine N-methyltransferase-like [Oscarella lobularis]|uniref:indolethylamine N-methyltransferase-like n=1 Tax=Oscarella lobularis TaxID=121494 RepID=UPI00331331A6
MTASEGETTLCSGDDYIRHFDPNIFIRDYYFNEAIDDGLEPFVMSKIHNFYTKTAHFQPDSASVLEFGGGATISHLISATPYASSIVLADYTPACLHVIDQWRKAPSKTEQLRDWTSHFRYIVQNLEMNDDDEAPKQRESQLKVKLSSLIPCNILDDKPLGNDDYDKRFDVVSSSFCLEVACRTHAQFKLSVKKLVGLLKGSGSWLVLSCVLGEDSYPVGEKYFFTLSLTEDVVKEALEEAGLRLVEFESIPLKQKEEKTATAACHAVGQLK